MSTDVPTAAPSRADHDHRPYQDLSLSDLVTQVEAQYDRGEQIGFELLGELISRAAEAERDASA